MYHEFVSFLFLNVPPIEHIRSELALVLGPLNIITFIMWALSSTTVSKFFTDLAGLKTDDFDFIFHLLIPIPRIQIVNMLQISGALDPIYTQISRICLGTYQQSAVEKYYVKSSFFNTVVCEGGPGVAESPSHTWAISIVF